MSGVSFSITVLADDINAMLAQLIARGDNLQPLMEDIGAAMVVSTKKRFEDERAPDGSPWLPSHRALVEGRTLRDKNLLYDSITYRATANSVEWGTNKIYGRIHQLGGDAGRGGKVKIPARPYLGMDDDDELTVATAIQDFLIDPSQFGGAA